MPRPFYLSTRHKSRPSEFSVVEHVGPETLGAIVLAAGAVARADGAADTSERQALLAFLRERGILERHGRASVLAAYAARTEGRRRSLADTADELAVLRRLAGTAAAPLVAAAALQVALADGIAWPQETALLGIISDQLGLRAVRASA